MMLMEYQSIIGEDWTVYSKQNTLNLLHAYIDAHIQRLIDEYPGDSVQAITRLQ